MKLFNRAKHLILPLTIAMLSSTSFAAKAESDADKLTKANQAIANPLTQKTLWITENNLFSQDGSLLTDGNEMVDVLIMDPLLPDPIDGTDWTVIHRPIVPAVFSFDKLNSDGSFSNRSGLGDISYFAAFSPKGDSNFHYGFGPFVQLPTATDPSFGSKKVSLGGVFLGVYSTPKFSMGFVNQNYFSVAGSDNRPHVARSTFQYFAFYNFSPKWGIGTAPTITYDYRTNELELPVGIGVTRSFLWGDTPVRNLWEFQKYVKNNPQRGNDWNFRIAFAMVLPRFFE